MERVGVAPISLFVLCLALVLAPIAGVGPPTGGEGGLREPTGVGADGSPVGPGDGVEAGVRWNQSLAIDATDGYNESELDTISARTMARVEVVRNVEFESSIPVEFRSREDFSRGTRSDAGSITSANRLHQNVKFEALFMLGEDTDAVATRNANTASGVIAYYSPARDTVVFIGPNDGTGTVDEPVLAQEFFHAFQYRHFDVRSFDRSTEDANNAALGLIEGDANLVQQRYAAHCRTTWDCLDASESAGGGGAGPRHRGLFLLSYFPYSDGPSFVDARRRSGGWAAVDSLYGAPPESSEQIIHPERYPDEEPRNVSLRRTGSGGWRVLDLEGGIDHATFGEAGLNVMLAYPAIESGGRRSVIPASHFYNREPGGLNRSDPFTYSHPYTDGWAGDKLHPYVTDRSAETNETGYVWRVAFDSTAHAREFLTGYRQLLQSHDAEPVDGQAGVWQIPDGPFEDAFRVTLADDTVVIVNGPSVETLDRIRSRRGDGGGLPTPEQDDEEGVRFERHGE
jgi:hypothetical protein